MVFPDFDIFIISTLIVRIFNLLWQEMEYILIKFNPILFENKLLQTAITILLFKKF
jgi:hypothetical protein